MATATPSTEGKASMTVRVDRATLAAFDALAEGRGGRSALLRSLLDQAMRQAGEAPRMEARTEAATNRLSFRLTEAEMAVLEARATERGTDRAGWVKALVRRHLGLKAPVDDGLRDALGPIRMQLQRIGRNLNQAMRAGNAAMMADSGLQIERELKRIVEMRQEISEQVAALGDALKGDMRYWQVED